jgi:hypothetical protein
LVKKIFTWLFIAFLIFFVAFRPAAAAVIARWIGAILSAIATGLGDFVSRVVSG